MDSFAYIYVLGVGLVAVLALSGHFGFGYGAEPLDFNYTRFMVRRATAFADLSIDRPSSWLKQAAYVNLFREYVNPSKCGGKPYWRSQT